MPRSRGEAPVTLSFLDRLIDDDIAHSPDIHLSRSQSVRKLKDAVRRDLEWLLNTRQPIEMAPEGSQLADSLYAYGLPDITSLSVSSLRDRQRLTEAIKTAVVKFEPRLTNVNVRLLSAGDEKSPSLRFVIEGLLRIPPSPEQISFDTLLQISTGEYKVQGEPSAR